MDNLAWEYPSIIHEFLQSIDQYWNESCHGGPWVVDESLMAIHEMSAWDYITTRRDLNKIIWITCYFYTEYVPWVVFMEASSLGFSIRQIISCLSESTSNAGIQNFRKLPKFSLPFLQNAITEYGPTYVTKWSFKNLVSSLHNGNNVLYKCTWKTHDNWNKTGNFSLIFVSKTSKSTLGCKWWQEKKQFWYAWTSLQHSRPMVPAVETLNAWSIRNEL